MVFVETLLPELSNVEAIKSSSRMWYVVGPEMNTFVCTGPA